MERTTWTLIVLFAVGAALLVLAIVPTAWPNPLADAAGDAPGPARQQETRSQLGDAAAAVAAACRDGDGQAFAAATTATYRRGLERRLQAVEGQLDGATLRRMAADDRSGPERWLTRPFEAVHVRGPFVAVSVRRDPELGEGQGAQVLVFEWDGTRFRLDEVRHATRVDDAEDAGRYLRELLRLR